MCSQDLQFISTPYYVLAETIIFCVFNGQDTEQFPHQFGDQIPIFDDVVLVVAADMDSVYVFICDGYGIADKENRLGGSSPDLIITGADIPFGKVQVKIKAFLPCIVTVVQLSHWDGPIQFVVLSGFDKANNRVYIGALFFLRGNQADGKELYLIK